MLSEPPQARLDMLLINNYNMETPIKEKYFINVSYLFLITNSPHFEIRHNNVTAD